MMVKQKQDGTFRIGYFLTWINVSGPVNDGLFNIRWVSGIHFGAYSPA
jgi:hypothetical protein